MVRWHAVTRLDVSVRVLSEMAQSVEKSKRRSLSKRGRACTWSACRLWFPADVQVAFQVAFRRDYRALRGMVWADCD